MSILLHSICQGSYRVLVNFKGVEIDSTSLRRVWSVLKEHVELEILLGLFSLKMQSDTLTQD